MGLRDLLSNSGFARVVLIVWLVSGAFVLFLMNELNGIVHGELYDYGLQFSFNWASPYWAFLNSIYICLAVPLVLSGVVLVFGFLNKGYSEKPVSKKVDTKSVNSKVRSSKENQNHLLANCPNCKRVFGKPLVMLDFSDGKTKLVNVCPYCNYVLGKADAKESDSDIGIVDLDEKVVRK
ncbi:MAG: hypothetical protein OEY22_10250 [Candidatus Bathyarchaeota archaeon]|nr:hypothetical protein [Candidatus Bathyarchaeota archaeon]MDH5787943.1 hypothetical protein [Candidatus Bathyarchaeota archaeon]